MDWQMAVTWTMFLFAAVAALACPVALGIEAWKAVQRDK